MPTVTMTYPYLSFLVSLIRYKRMSKVNGWKSDFSLIILSIISISIIYSYFIIIAILNAIYDLNIINTYNTCISWEGAESNNSKIAGLIAIGPMIIVLIVTFLLDLKCYWFIRTRVNDSTNQGGFMNRVDSNYGQKRSKVVKNR